MYSEEIKIGFADSDPGGIMFFSRIFEYAHEAYENMLSGMDLKTNYFTDTNFALPLIHAEADFKSPIRIHEKITVQIFVEEIRDSSFDLKYTFMDNENNLKALVKTIHVMISKSTGEKHSLTEELKRAFLSMGK